MFDSFYLLTPKKFSKDNLNKALKALDGGEYGEVLRAKGVVESESGWIHFDYVPELVDVRDGAPDVSGKICVIGVKLNKDKIKELFGN